MAARTTKKEMETAVRLLNQDLGFAEGSEGSFTLEGAYGGWRLVRFTAGTAIVNVPGMYGFHPKKKVTEFVENLRLGVKYGTLMCHKKI